MNPSELEGNNVAWGNACKEVMIGLCFTSDWLKKWRASFKPIIKRSNENQSNYKITFGTIENRPHVLTETAVVCDHTPLFGPRVSVLHARRIR